MSSPKAEQRWLLYGATGFTGRLLAEEAVRRGHRPTLAGRSREKVEALARELDLPFAAASIDDAVGLRKMIEGHALVLHAAGPFIHTSLPMLHACLETRAHYLDITGEIPVFEQGFAHDAKAKERGVAILSGVGFDVVPTDCLAAYVAKKVESPTELLIAISAIGEPSGGTLKSSVEALPRGDFVRRDGKLVRWTFGRGEKTIRFPHGAKGALPIPWGDLVTAFHSTGIPNITTYMTMPRSQLRSLRVIGPALPTVFSVDALRNLALRRIESKVTGPNAAKRAASRAYAWAQARNARGEGAEAWIETPEGYDFTALSGIRAVEQTLAREPRGALTPAMAFGTDFVLEIPGTRRLDAI